MIPLIDKRGSKFCIKPLSCTTRQEKISTKCCFLRARYTYEEVKHSCEIEFVHGSIPIKYKLCMCSRHQSISVLNAIVKNTHGIFQYNAIDNINVQID